MTWYEVSFKILFPVFILFLAGKKKIPLFISLTVCAFISGLLFKMPLFELENIFIRALLSEDTLSLALVVALIQVFNEILEATGRLAELVDRLKRMQVSPFLRLAFFPVLIGLLPMPGGAVFSAPMVKAASKEDGLSPHRMALINYWFRHVCEYSWPLYPSMIIVAGISGCRISFLCLLFFPVTLFSIFCGYYLIIRCIKPKNLICSLKEDKNLQIKEDKNSQIKEDKNSQIKEFLKALWPLFLMIGLFFILENILPPGYIIKYSGMLAALVSVIFLQLFTCFQLAFKGIKAVFLKFSFYNMILSVVSIMFFKAVIEAGGAVQLVKVFSATSGALFFITILLPFFSGLALGYGPGVVGSTFPIVYNYASSASNAGMPLWIIVSFCSGFMGILLSPAHLCLTVSKEYFDASAAKMYKGLFRLVGLLAFLISIYSLFLYYSGLSVYLVCF
jgi:integral membrane protein (TIGR00529 family)